MSYDKKQAQPYIDAGFDLVPLHEWSAVGPNGLPLGKIPVGKGWPDIPRDSAEVVKKAGTRNVGVHLKRPDLLVIDIDPRAKRFRVDGVGAFKRLVEAAGLETGDFAHYPAVKTGSGGFHIYMAKPEGFVPCGSMPKDFHGVEFKAGKGKQVVAAGSRHPNGRRYEWDESGPRLRVSSAFGDFEAPTKLLDFIEKSKADMANAEPGDYDPEKLGRILAQFDPTAFKDYHDWLYFMMECHHATNGQGDAEFIEWSTSDPEFSNADAEIQKKWDGFAAKDGRKLRTVRSFNHRLRRAGLGHMALSLGPSAEEDFADEELD